MNEIKLAIRRLLKNPGFVAVTVLLLTLGIGLNLDLITRLNRLFFQPRPVSHPEELFAVLPADSAGNPQNFNLCRPYYEAVRANSRGFKGLIGYAQIYPTFRTSEGWETIKAELVSGDFFNMLGVAPIKGRTFIPSVDDKLGAIPVAVISHRFWQSRFGGDPNILGRKLSIKDQIAEVIGIAPPAFTGLDELEADVWLPASLEKVLDEYSVYTLVGRVESKMAPQAIASTLSPTIKEITSRQMKWEFPGYDRYGYSPDFSEVFLQPCGYGKLGPWADRTQLSRSFGLVGIGTSLLLLITCANTANLLLARALGQRKEMAARIALGATRWRLVRLWLWEGILLAGIGTAGACLLLQWFGNIATFNGNINDSQFDFAGQQWRILFAAGACVLLVGIGFSILPAINCTRFEPFAVLKDANGEWGTSRSRWSLKETFMVAQVAGSLVILTAALLCFRSMNSQLSQDVGFKTGQLLTASLDLPKVGATTNTAPQIIRELADKLRLLPGVASVGVTADRLFSGYETTLGLSVLEGYTPPPGEGAYFQNSNIGADTFASLGIPILQGRDINSSDLADNRKVAVINEEFVHNFWPGQFPLGKKINDYEVIGVSRNARLISPIRPARPQVFFEARPSELLYPTFVIRCNGNPNAITRSIQATISESRPGLRETPVLPLSELMERSLPKSRLALRLLTALGILAIVVTLLGGYGLMSYFVTRRTREIGIRLAMGARPGEINRLILMTGGRLAIIGICLGWPAAAVAAHFLRHLLFGVGPFDPTTYLVAAGLSLLTITLACLLPAHRAAKLDPMEVLRNEG